MEEVQRNTPAKEAGLTRNGIGGRDSDVRDSGDVQGEEGGDMLEGSVGHSGQRSQPNAAATSHGKSKSEHWARVLSSECRRPTSSASAK